MTNYTLYLDESTTHSGKFKDNAFCMAGIITKDEHYETLQLELDKLKNKIWNDIPNYKDIILHQMQIITSVKSKQDSSLKVEREYERFKQNIYCKNLYEDLGKIFDLNFMTVIGASLDIKNMNIYYNCGNNLDPYLITLQMILENYCHFLCKNGGRGKIVYESTGEISDQQLLDRYYHIKLMGSMYYTKEVMNKRLLSMNFISKLANNAGLQIADFVPNYFARKQKNFKPHRFNIDKQLRIYRYDGEMNLRDRFGVKNMP